MPVAADRGAHAARRARVARHGKVAPPRQRAPPFGQRRKRPGLQESLRAVSELRTIARHATTVLVGQLAVMAFGVTDTIVAGRYSEQALAALSVGSAVYITVFVALMGILQALLPTW